MPGLQEPQKKMSSNNETIAVVGAAGHQEAQSCAPCKPALNFKVGALARNPGKLGNSRVKSSRATTHNRRSNVQLISIARLGVRS
jgi:hypothetical protein